MSAPPRPWTGLTPEQSTPGDFALPHPEPGAPNVVLDRARRHRLRAARMLRLRHRDAAHRSARRERAPVQPLPRDRALLADPRVPAHRAQPLTRSGWASSPTCPMAYPGLHGRIPKSAATLPRLLRDAGYNTIAVGKWHLVPVGRAFARGAVRPVAARLRLRALLRIPPGRHQPVEPEPRPRQPLRRSAGRARRRLPPHRGPRRHRDPLRPGPEARRARPPVLPLLRARRDARAASRRAGVGRAVPRSLRRRVGAVARARCSRARSRPASCPRAPCSRTAPAWVQDWDALSADERRVLRALPGGVRRLPDAHRRADRARGRRSSRRSASSTTRS